LGGSVTEEAEQAFQELKQHLVSPLVLVAPEPREPLYLYIVVAAEAVSMVLVVERTTQEGQELEDLVPGAGVRTV
jgi:ribonuclease HI